MKRVYTGWAVARSRFGLRSFSYSRDSCASTRAGSRSWTTQARLQDTSARYISPQHRHFKEGM